MRTFFENPAEKGRGLPADPTALPELELGIGEEILLFLEETISGRA